MTQVNSQISSRRHFISSYTALGGKAKLDFLRCSHPNCLPLCQARILFCFVLFCFITHRSLSLTFSLTLNLQILHDTHPWPVSDFPILTMATLSALLLPLPLLSLCMSLFLRFPVYRFPLLFLECANPCCFNLCIPIQKMLRYQVGSHLSNNVLRNLLPRASS